MLVEESSIPGSVNWRKTFQGISAVWENGETRSLEKFLFYLHPITLQLHDFIYWIVFDLLFCRLTVKTIYSLQTNLELFWFCFYTTETRGMKEKSWHSSSCEE